MFCLMIVGSRKQINNNGKAILIQNSCSLQIDYYKSLIEDLFLKVEGEGNKAKLVDFNTRRFLYIKSITFLSFPNSNFLFEDFLTLTMWDSMTHKEIE